MWPSGPYAWVWDDEYALRCGTTGCLFNLTADPRETTNIAEARPADVTRLMNLLHAAPFFEADAGPEMPTAFMASCENRSGFLGPFAEDLPASEK